MVRRIFVTELVLGMAALGLLSGCGEPVETVSITAKAETEQVLSVGDAADDPAIWRNSADPASSLVFGTDKKAGLYVYGLNGKVVQFLPVGRVNNVDLVEATDFGGVVVAASNRTTPGVSLFVYAPGAAQTVPFNPGFLPLDVAEPYGLCMAKMGETIRIAVTSKQGDLRLMTLRRENGVVVSDIIALPKLGSVSEGCVFDAKVGHLYVAEENVGIWRLGVGQGADPAPAMFAELDGAILNADIEGLALDKSVSPPLLVASSQSDNAYAVFDTGSGDFIGKFKVAASELIDGASHTDGIDLAPGDFGADFPNGLLVVQDDFNSGADAPQTNQGGEKGQNFKFISWADVLTALGR